MGILRKIFLVAATFMGVAAYGQQTTITDCFAKSYKLEQSQKYKEAINELKRVKADTYAKNLRLGWLYYLAGEYKTGVMYYTKAINLRPTSVEARLGYVLPAAKLKEWTKVGEQYDAILKIDPNNYKANYYRGLMYYNMGEYKKAQDYLSRLEKLYPFDYDALILYGWNTYYMNDKNRAKILFYQARLVRPESASAKEGLEKCR